MPAEKERSLSGKERSFPAYKMMLSSDANAATQYMIIPQKVSQYSNDTFMGDFTQCVCKEMTQVTYEKPGIFAKDIFLSSQVSLSGQQ